MVPVAIIKSRPSKHVSLIGAAQTVCRNVCVPTVIGTLCTNLPCTGSAPIPESIQTGPKSVG